MGGAGDSFSVEVTFKRDLKVKGRLGGGCSGRGSCLCQAGGGRGREGCRLFRVGAERVERRVQGEAGGAAGAVSQGSVSGEEEMGRRVSGWPVRKCVRQC